MGRRKNRSWAMKWCSFFTSFAFLSTVGGDLKTDTKIPTEAENQTPSSCYGQFKPKQQENPKNLMLVSTLDGKLSALDISKSGALDWAIDTGSGPLLSSSISKLEVNRNGVITRLIPSLDGGLYQFDGETVEPVPFTADTLLSSSFRFNDDSTIVGGKETETYGIDAATGKIKYVCTVNGCNNLEDDSEVGDKPDDSDVLIITRSSKTVRAVEMRTGAEKWNFSVGHHEVSFISNKVENNVIAGITDESSGDGPGEYDQDGVFIEEPCMDEEYPEHSFEFPWWGSDAKQCKLDVDLKVIVPAGRVVAMSRSEPNKILWQHKFNTGIANAWTLTDGTLEEVNLFDGANNPALAIDESTIHHNVDEDIPDSPALFIGMHNKQMYVQPSVQMMQAVEEAVNKALHRGSLVQIDMPHITWNPYIASAPSRTPAVTEFRRPLHKTWDETRDKELIEEERSLALWHEQYPYDSGFYLMADPLFGRDKYYLPHPRGEEECGEDCEHSEEDTAFNQVTHTLWNWKEVLLFGIFMSVVTHVFIEKVIYKRKLRSEILRCGEEPSEEGTAEAMEVKPEEITIVEKQPEFVSRYYTDFEQIECLGKGGFGVVFKARNKVDDCHYAIKRISLNKSDKAKEKVMREVKALANLEHSGIVRYNQAWFESPPPGWQEERDKDLISTDDNSMFTNKGFSISEYVPKQTKVHQDKQQKDAKPSNFNPLRPFEDPLLATWSVSERSENTVNSTSDEFDNSETGSGSKPLTKRGSSEGFTPQFDHDLEWDESGSYSLGTPSLNATLAAMADDSLSIDFVDQDTSKENTDIPFKNMNENTAGSLDIIFEDSKCGDSSQSSHKTKSESNNDSQESESDSKSFNDDSECCGDSGARSEKCENVEDVDVSFDIVFEDSGCGDKSRSNHSDKTSEDPILDISVNTPISRTGTISKSSLKDTATSGSPPRPDVLNLPTVAEKLNTEAGENSQVTPLPRLYLYIQMQLCKKESLRDWLADNTLNRDRCKLTNIFGEIVSAMDYVHDRGLMHRDLKPSNIFFAQDGTVKIGDFGLVTQAEEECLYISGQSARTPMTPYFSKHTDQVGTKLYMSPEQNAGRPYDYKVDIYAMGLIFFELFYPFATAMERIKTLMEVKRCKFPSRFARELPNECHFVKKLVSHNPDERPNTNEILEHKILLPYHDAKESYRRNRTSSRNRTMSTSSSENSIPNTP